jgi:hypothetical protein
MTDDEATDDDAAWLAALAGRSVADEPGATASSRAEGAMLRSALTRWRPAIEDVATHDPARVARLIARARAVGLLDAIEPSAVGAFARMRATLDRWTRDNDSARRRRFATWAVPALVVVVAAIAYVGVGDRRDVSDDRTVRSADGTVVRLKAVEPMAVQRQLVSALAEQGIKATPYVRFGRYGVDADLPSSPSPELRALLARQGIPLPGDGVLRVEIEAAER